MDRAGERLSARPAVFRSPGALIYAGNCADLLAASQRGEVRLEAFARAGYPGQPLGGGLPQVCSIGYWDCSQAQSWGLREHCNEGVKLGLVARGNLDVTIEGQQHQLAPGDLFAVRPWQLHAIGNPAVGPSRYIWLLLDVGVRRPHEHWVWPDWLGWAERDLAELTRLLSQSERCVFRGGRLLFDAFERIAAIVAAGELDRNETALRLAASAMLLEAKTTIASSDIALDTALTSSCKTVAVFLKRLRHALAEDWTLDGMARECGLSRTQFSKHCQNLTNTTPARYLKALRLEAAVARLGDDCRSSVTEIAFEHGFASSQYFATSVRQKLGRSPTALRREAAAS